MKLRTSYRQLETWILITGLILVVINQFFVQVNQTTSLIFLGVTLLCFGLPHGSIDHLVEEKSAGKIDLIRFIIIYLAQVAMVAVCWFFLPLPSILFFLLLSAWHFAETDLAIPPQKNGFTSALLKILYGTGILSWILFVHPTQTLNYLQHLSPTFGHASFIGKKLAVWHMAIMVFCGSITMLAATIYSIKQQDFILIKTALLLLVTYFLPLLAAFAFYFGLWHSLHALMHIKNHLHLSWKNLFLQALPLSIVSVLGLIFFLTLINHLHLNLVLLTFIFISALTLPHARVMSTMYRTKNKTPAV